jgi:hypothetical protein
MSLRKKITQNVAKTIFCQICRISVIVENIRPKFLATFCKFHKAAQSKQSPYGRKFSQSGHPAWSPKFSCRKIMSSIQALNTSQHRSMKYCSVNGGIKFVWGVILKYFTTPAPPRKCEMKTEQIFFRLWPIHRNLRTRAGMMHLCVQGDQNGQEMRVLQSVDETRLTHFML